MSLANCAGRIFLEFCVLRGLNKGLPVKVPSTACTNSAKTYLYTRSRFKAAMSISVHDHHMAVWWIAHLRRLPMSRSLLPRQQDLQKFIDHPAGLVTGSGFTHRTLEAQAMGQRDNTRGKVRGINRKIG
jgi:hypothetical protein